MKQDWEENLRAKHKLAFDNVLLPMGFKRTEDDFIYSHKMFPEGLFDFSATSTDPYWIMDTIFKRCKDAGAQAKAEEVRKVLYIG